MIWYYVCQFEKADSSEKEIETHVHIPSNIHSVLSYICKSQILIKHYNMYINFKKKESQITIKHYNKYKKKKSQIPKITKVYKKKESALEKKKNESAIEHERALNKDFMSKDMKIFSLPMFLKYPKNVV